MDNGKVKICMKDGVPIVEVYHDGEIELSDVIWIHHNMLNDFNPPLKSPSNIIINRVGSYSLSEDAYMCLTTLMRDAGHVAFVIHHKPQEVVIELASKTYLSNHNVKKFHSLSDACEWMASH